MSFSWVDPHFAALYARREDERLAAQLVMRSRERADYEPPPNSVNCREAGWMEQEAATRGHLRLL